jgi:prepilin-type N-terminal cleavage/methylation domain-containing protein
MSFHLAKAIGCCSKRRGFTLLELVLALSMSVVLMVLIGGAIQFYARDMNVRDMDIRQTQVAAAIMQMIEDDLRATLHPQPTDTAPLEELLSSASGSQSGSGGGGQEPEEDLSAAGLESEPTESLADDLMTIDLQAGVSVLDVPGLIGNQYQIQLDLSRLPRLEEYVAMLDENTADIDDVPSDIKTVAYFVQAAETIGGVQDALNTIDPQAESLAAGGLVRRSLDRAASVQAASTGSLSLLNQTGDLLAPEIVAIEFSYWDGVTWQLEWSSDEYGELPLAVQVRLTLRDERASAAAAAPTATGGLDTSELRTFSHIVRLPLARPIEETPEDILSGAGI